jgi:starch synthase
MQRRSSHLGILAKFEWMADLGCLLKVDSLQTALAQAEAERTSMSKVHSENLDLRNQVQLLEQRLQDSDVEIRSQLRMYEEEVQAFQASLEGLKAEAQVGTMQIAVGEMPWDFWSSMMLQIEALMLDSLITQEDAKELRLMAWRREKAIRDTYVTLQEEVDEDMAAGLLDLIKPHSRPGLYIVNISAEMAPVAKVGGLGDVVTGLSRSLQRKGHLVEIILPKYDCMDYTRIKSLQELDLELHSFFDGQIHKNKVWSGIVEGMLPISHTHALSFVSPSVVFSMSGTHT